MAFNKYAGIFTIILGILAVIGIFLPIAIFRIDLMGVFGWEIKLNCSPLGIIERDSIGILAPIAAPIYDTFLNILYPSLTSNILLTVMTYAMVLLSFLIIIFGILELIKSESLAFPIINIIFSSILFLLPIYAHITFDNNLVLKYLTSINTTQSLLKIAFPSLPLLLALPEEFPAIGFYLIFISQIVVTNISIAALIINAINKKKRK